MYLFKYYRPDFFFDKAIRYNELYFSSAEQLNDPNDLKTSFYFEDNVHLWQKILESALLLGVRELKEILDFSNLNLARELCQIFKGIPMNGSIELVDEIFEKNNLVITTTLDKNLKKIDLIDPSLIGDSNEQRPLLISICKKGIKERIIKGLRSGIYSVSFSTNALEPMMWAHYAAGFKGCVIIYNASNNQICLKRNIYSREYYPFDVESIKYQNQEKHIPILTSALGDDRAIRDTLLAKNSFWSYEAEKRLFHTRPYITSHIWNLSFKNTDYSDRIFHHEPSLIAGVIFGPGFDTNKKEFIEFLLRDTRQHTPCESFYLFDTKLTNKGTIVVISGKEVNSNHRTEMTGALSMKDLPKVLEKLGISNP